MLSGQRLLLVVRCWALCSLAILLLNASSPVSLSYWQQQFTRWPAGFAHSASYYGVGEASHWLAETYWRQEQRSTALDYYRRAVEQGDAGAAYALSVHVPAHRERWLQAAAELGDREATLLVAAALADDAPQRALSLLQPLSAGSRRDELVARLVLNNPALTDQPWQVLAPDSPRWNARRSAADWLEQSVQCTYWVSVVNDAPRGREAFLDWISEWQHSPLRDLGMCFHLEQALTAQCDLDDGRVNCQLSDQHEGESRYPLRWFIATQGRANARPSELHLAVNSAFPVLVHELAHWFGLADEYPMREPLAENFCTGRYRFDARNIALTASPLVTEAELEQLENELPWKGYLEQPIAQKVGPNQYRLGSMDITKTGLFMAQTCLHTDYYAWKPVAELTFMEQHEIGRIPPLYLELMKQGLAQQ